MFAKQIFHIQFGYFLLGHRKFTGHSARFRSSGVCLYFNGATLHKQCLQADYSITQNTLLNSKKYLHLLANYSYSQTVMSINSKLWVRNHSAVMSWKNVWSEFLATYDTKSKLLVLCFCTVQYLFVAVACIYYNQYFVTVYM